MKKHLCNHKGEDDDENEHEPLRIAASADRRLRKIAKAHLSTPRSAGSRDFPWSD